MKGDSQAVLPNQPKHEITQCLFCVNVGQLKTQFQPEILDDRMGDVKKKGENIK